MPYLGSEKQVDNMEVTNAPSPLMRPSDATLFLAATVASAAFFAAFAASLAAAALSAYARYPLQETSIEKMNADMKRG